MAEQRQGFRFRLPWQSAAPTPPPAPAPRRQPPPSAQQQSRLSPPESQKTTTPTSSSSTNPAQKSPSKPPGSSQPQAQGSARNDRPQVNSKPASPSRTATQSRTASVPPSPSRGGTQRPSPSRVPKAAAKPPSPSRLTPPSPHPMPKPSASSETKPASPNSEPPAEASSLPPSSLTVTEAQSAGAGTQSPNPSRPSQVETPDVNPPSLDPVPSSQKVLQEEPEPTTGSSAPKQQQIKADITSVNVMDNSKSQSPKKMAIHPKEDSSVEAIEMSDSPLVRTEASPLSESDGNSEETVAERKKTVQELARVEASSSRAHTKTRPSLAAFEEEEKQAQDKEDVLVKEALAKPNSNGKQANPVSLNPRDKSRVIHSHNHPPQSNGEHGPLHKEIAGDISKFVHKMTTTQHPKHAAEDKQVTVITLAGDNKGASMQLGGSDALKREGKIHIRRGYKTNQDKTHDTTTDGEESSERPSSENEVEQALETFVNSNVQSVNNSIVFDSSITETNPGVKVVVSPEMKEPVKKPSKKSDTQETKKAEVNVTPAEKHTYQPTVRRRCLKGLMMESSDSDPDNPDKPPRHGCRVACKDKGKNSEINVL